jgi:hypothetical protein
VKAARQPRPRSVPRIAPRPCAAGGVTAPFRAVRRAASANSRTRRSKGLRLRIGRRDSFADPRYQGGFILGAKGAEATVLANQRTLVALCPFAPLSLEVGLLRHAGLAGEMSNNATSNVFATIREAAIELEGLKKNGKLSRVAPVFVPRSSSSLSESVQCRASSSGCQSCFMGRLLADSIPAPSQNWPRSEFTIRAQHRNS